MIDWSDAEPDFVRPQNVVEIRTLDDAMKLIDQWQVAYAELNRDYVRMHDAYCKAKWRAESMETLAFGFESLYVAALDPANDDVRAELRANYKP